MVNELKVAKVLSIQALHAQGWSQRRIARELGIHRGTVARHLGQASKPATAPIGSADGEVASKPAKAPTGSDSGEELSKPAKAPTGFGHEPDDELSKNCPPETEWTGTSSASTGASSLLPAGDAASGTRSQCEPYHCMSALSC